MSGRMTKWLVIVVLPIVFALYASYPPVGVKVAERQVEVKTASTDTEARQLESDKAYRIGKGRQYVAKEKVTSRGFLPLALGKKDHVSTLKETREDGTLVQEVVTVARGRVKLGLDLAGGTELLYQLKGKKGESLTGKAATTIDILKKRIDPSNVKEYRIQALEHDRILIQVPRATAAEVQQLKVRLARMGRLEFKIAIPEVSENAEFQRMYEEVAEGRIPDGYTTMRINDNPAGKMVLVKEGEAAITGRYLSPGKLARTTDKMGRPAVGFEFNPMGARKFAQITEDYQGWALAIVLDGVLTSAPSIRERISGGGEISGSFTEQDVIDHINILRAGSLPMDIELLQESTVGPQLGRDSIRKGLRALAVAGLLVLVFIGFYYLRCGLVADAALIMNLVLLVGVLCLLGAALTLPGMAGILLTVGMAVDANVLIFERIREESAAGKGIRIALRNGYERAFTTIVDANVTTLLTAIILYMIGTGPVRGFAVTLSFGILLSMFTALVVTRLAFETFIDRGWMREFKMLSVIHEPRIEFTRIRKPAYLLSMLVVAVGLVAFVARGSDLYDIDFTGGSLVHISLAEPSTIGDIRARLDEGGFPNAEVQGVHTAGAEGGALTDFSIRIKGGGVDVAQVKSEVRAKLQKAGILGEDDKLEVATDKRALVLTVAQAVAEETLRAALADGNPFALRDLSTLVPNEEVTADEVVVRLQGVSSLTSRQDLMSRMLSTLAWAELSGTDYAVVKCEPEGGDAPTSVRLELDKPIQAELLSIELARTGAPEVEVAAAGEDGTAFVLTGAPEALAQFCKELPAGDVLRNMRTVDIDGSTVTARLAKPFSEQDIRALFERRGMSNVLVMLKDTPSETYRLNLSLEPIRDKLESLFVDLAAAGGAVEFADSDEPVADGKVSVLMTLPEPMTLDDVRLYFEVAGMGPYADDVIVPREGVGPITLVHELPLALPAADAATIRDGLKTAFAEAHPVQKIVDIGPSVARELRGRALLAVVFASVIIVLYVALRFHAFRFGVAAVIALVHDILITAGLIALADYAGVLGDVKVGLATLAAFLTILGYSLNDTIVVFDRIRENMGTLGVKRVSASLIDQSINQTLSRTILTSLTTLMVVAVLYVLGGTVLQGLALTLMIGVVVGTYSSMFIASPILLDWAELTHGTGVAFKVVFLPITLPLKGLRRLLGGG